VRQGGHEPELPQLPDAHLTTSFMLVLQYYSTTVKGIANTLLCVVKTYPRAKESQHVALCMNTDLNL
jgi:hypothetical protein